MTLGMKWPFGIKYDLTFSLKELRENKNFQRAPKVGYTLILISFAASFLGPLVPSQLNFVLYLLNKLLFIGLLYLYFSGQRPKTHILILGLTILLFSSIQQGMFGELIYMSALAFIIVTIGAQLSFLKKSSIFTIGLLCIIVLQNIKHEYRRLAWTSGADSAYFFELISNRIDNPDLLYSEEGLFALSYRFNQGWLISATMDRVPRVVPFAEGETIFTSILASFVPRLLWPNKPISGGEANVERFLGKKNLGYSINISPIGEAWANFGYWKGIAFMFFYGFFIRLIFNYLLKLIQQTPTLLFWLPLLFFYVIRAESDILTGINHLFKSGFFVFMMYKVSHILFGQKL